MNIFAKYQMFTDILQGAVQIIITKFLRSKVMLTLVFYFSAIKEWNNLLKHLKHVSNIAGFKSAIHGYLSKN